MEPILYKVSGIWVVVSIVLWTISAIVVAFTIIVPLIAFVMIVRSIMSYLTTSVIVDDRGVTLRRALISVTEQRFPIGNIHAVSTSVGPLGSQFDYGTITLSVGNDQNQIKIGHIAGCQDLKEHLEPRLAK